MKCDYLVLPPCTYHCVFRARDCAYMILSICEKQGILILSSSRCNKKKKQWGRNGARALCKRGCCLGPIHALVFFLWERQSCFFHLSYPVFNCLHTCYLFGLFVPSNNQERWQSVPTLPHHLCEVFSCSSAYAFLRDLWFLSASYQECSTRCV